MKFSIPPHLDDPMIRENERIAHGEALSIVDLSEELTRRRTIWLEAHPGWVFTNTALVKCEDGTPSPGYDVLQWYHRPRTPAELEVQAAERSAWLEKKQADYRKREEEQRAILEEVMASLKLQ